MDGNYGYEICDLPYVFLESEDLQIGNEKLIKSIFSSRLKSNGLKTSVEVKFLVHLLCRGEIMPCYLKTVTESPPPLEQVTKIETS